jgi:queuine tRNA-ribosyltransferase
MFDCVLPTRNARHGQAWVTGDETLSLKSERYKTDEQILDPGCDCSTCKAGYSRAFLRHMFSIGEYLAGRLVSVHNLHYLHRVIAEESQL